MLSRDGGIRSAVEAGRGGGGIGMEGAAVTAMEPAPLDTGSATIT
jgi:hypothetical protein